MSPKTSPKKIWIFGSGTFALSAYQAAISAGIDVEGILDHNNSGFKLFENSPVRTYDIFDDFSLNNAPIYFAVCNPYADLLNLMNKVHSSKENASVYSPVELCILLSQYGQKLQQYWLTTEFQIYENNSSKISSFKTLLCDEKSKDLFDKILEYRTEGKWQSLPTGEGVESQYLPIDLATPPKVLNVIELGSCGGENLQTFIERGFQFRSGYALEPDLYNYETLLEVINRLNLFSLHAVPLAAWNREEKLRFNSHAGSSSAVTEEGSDFVQATSLDNLIPKSAPINYIKMDIEGAELNALRGAHQIIQRSTPHLAICIYHTPEDFWEIGLWIHQNFGGKYSFYIRTYAEQTFETVLYCIPN